MLHKFVQCCAVMVVASSGGNATADFQVNRALSHVVRGASPPTLVQLLPRYDPGASVWHCLAGALSTQEVHLTILPQCGFIFPPNLGIRTLGNHVSKAC